MGGAGIQGRRRVVSQDKGIQKSPFVTCDFAFLKYPHSTIIFTTLNHTMDATLGVWYDFCYNPLHARLTVLLGALVSPQENYFPYSRKEISKSRTYPLEPTYKTDEPPCSYILNP